MIERLPAIVILLAAIAFAGCGATFPAQPTTAAPLSALIVHYPTSGTKFLVGSFDRYEAYTVDDDGVYVRVTDNAAWTSSNPTVLRANTGSGSAFFAAAAGTADIYATYQGLVGSVTVTVQANPRPVPYLDVDLFVSYSVTGSVDDAHARVFQTTGSGQDVTASASWSSSNSQVATVDSRGFVTLVAPGNVQITATSNGLSGSSWLSAPPRTR